MDNNDDPLTEVPAYGRCKRLQRYGKKLVGRWHRPGYDVRLLLRDNRPCYKKVVFGSAEQAEQIFANIEAFRGSPHFPAPVSCAHGSVVVAFVAGRPLERGDAATRIALAQFYAAVFSRQPTRVPVTGSGIREVLESHLRTLDRLAAVAPGHTSRLRERAAALAPTHLWMGFDYTDPILSNLVITAACQSVCAIDLKNLRADQPLGIGLAKARARWLTASDVSEILATMRSAGAPDIESYFDFIRLFERVARIASKRKKEAALTGGRWLAYARRRRLTYTDLAG